MLFRSLSQPIHQQINNHQIHHNPPGTNQHWRTHTSQSMYTSFIPQQNQQPQNSYYPNTNLNKSGFIRRI